MFAGMFMGFCIGLTENIERQLSATVMLLRLILIILKSYETYLFYRWTWFTLLLCCLLQLFFLYFGNGAYELCWMMDILICLFVWEQTDCDSIINNSTLWLKGILNKKGLLWSVWYPWYSFCNLNDLDICSPYLTFSIVNLSDSFALSALW